jgi:hypothetical protein
MQLEPHYVCSHAELKVNSQSAVWVEYSHLTALVHSSTVYFHLTVSYVLTTEMVFETSTYLPFTHVTRWLAREYRIVF